MDTANARFDSYNDVHPSERLLTDRRDERHGEPLCPELLAGAGLRAVGHVERVRLGDGVEEAEHCGATHATGIADLREMDSCVTMW